MLAMNLDSKKLGEAIKIAFKKKKYRQMKASYTLSIHQTRISRYMNGHFKRPNQTLIRICDYAGINYNDYIVPEIIDSRPFQKTVAQIIRGDKRKEKMLLKILNDLRALGDL
jgi:predicted XRE-type DNA-binding protein